MFLLAIFLLSVVIYLLAIKPYNYWAKKGVLYVKPTPLIGNVGRSLLRKTSFPQLMEELYKEYHNHRYIGCYQFVNPALLVKDPELIKQITVKDFEVFPEHRAFADEDVDPLWGKNLFAMRGGQRWHDMRATLSPSFTSAKMRIMYGLMKECAEQFTEYFERKGGAITVELKDAFTRFTNDVIATTAFGIQCDSLREPNNEFYLMGKETVNFSGIRILRFSLASLCPKLTKLLKIRIFNKKVSTFFRSIIKETLQVREEKGIVRPDMIQLLMETRKGSIEVKDSGTVDSGFAVAQESKTNSSKSRQNIHLSDDDITAQAIIFFLGGFESVATLMCFLGYELALNTDIQERLFQEITKTIEDNNGEISYESVLSMKYLDMVVSETLRKWPPTATLDRMSVRPFTIEPKRPGETPVHLEANSNIWIPVYAIHRDPKYYPNPEKFDPERFSDENKHNIQPFTFLPFGVGPRNCIASRFALLEAKLVLTEIIRKFEFVPVDKTPIPMVLSTTNIILSAEGGFWIGLKPRT